MSRREIVRTSYTVAGPRPARGPPTGWDELVQQHDDRDAIQSSPDDLPVIDIRSL